MTTAVVTGAAQGLGLACAKALLAQGYDVVGLDLTVNSEVPELILMGCDITDQAAISSAFEQIVAEFGNPTICINAAGIYPRSTLATATPELYRKLFDVNVLGTVLVSQAFVDAAADKDAVLVNVASEDGIHPTPKSVLYSASKAAVVNLTAGIAAEVAARGVRVIGVAPGYIATDTVKQLVGNEAGLSPDAATPEEMADAILRLATGGGTPLMTGQTVLLRTSAIERPKVLSGTRTSITE